MLTKKNTGNTKIRNEKKEKRVQNKFVNMGVSKNNGIPKSSILTGFSIK